MAFAIPMFLLFIFGYAITWDVKDIRTSIYDLDKTQDSRQFVANLRESGYFMIINHPESYRNLEMSIEKGGTLIGIVIPSDFSKDIKAGKTVSIQALIDGSDSNTALISLGFLNAITQRSSIQFAAEKIGIKLVSPIELRPRVWYNPELSSKNLVVPGLMAVIMMVIAALLTSLTIAREWDRGTMEQLIATPIRRQELILGKLLPYLVIGFIDILLCVIVGTLIFGVPFRGNLLLLMGLSIFFLVGAMSLGILISVVARSQLLASQVAMITTYVPSIILSGFMFPISNMPAFIQYITYLVPARYFVTITKGIFLKGIGPSILWREVIFLLIFSAGMILAANLKFKKWLK